MAWVSHAHLHCHGRESTSIAAAITAVHIAQTGAPRFFTQVLFSTANEGDHFVCGRVNSAPQVYLHGLLREGRSIEIKQALMSQMLEEIAHIVDITAEDVWIYLQDIPATQMIEFGRFLPAPGDEAEREKGMSAE
ncbi:cis-3-chloroacrylic acid dehalogenase [Marinobacter nauticus]|uniref:tautomerase family protein n=1 Tax=Marinobacter nauticus TaxID=2743 RepID=UPI00112F8082|nr:tautomerase family protein [Marinobacter nauticus]TPW24472.1 cis-3-chloroacrylic acid dehalogenase [Marinobacter nauticus]